MVSAQHLLFLPRDTLGRSLAMYLGVKARERIARRKEQRDWSNYELKCFEDEMLGYVLAFRLLGNRHLIYIDRGDTNFPPVRKD